MNSNSQRYKKRKEQLVSAVQLELDTEGFTFQKWGGTQHCHSGDWIVRSDNDCYTVGAEIFKRTYTEVSPGRFVKHAIIRARQAEKSGTIKTHEGETRYEAGDFLIDNSNDGSDCYAISKERFHELYDRVDQ